ncbi:MAG: hypothetical protein AAGI70_07740, partial [Pseudomonadota bacterium]
QAIATSISPLISADPTERSSSDRNDTRVYPIELSSGIDFSLVTGFGADETLFPSFVSRGITGGTATASVAAIPLPAPAALLLGALGFLATFRLWSRRRLAV